jgi:hypothetical protein
MSWTIWVTIHQPQQFACRSISGYLSKRLAMLPDVPHGTTDWVWRWSKAIESIFSIVVGEELAGKVVLNLGLILLLVKSWSQS